MEKPLPAALQITPKEEGSNLVSNSDPSTKSIRQQLTRLALLILVIALALVIFAPSLSKLSFNVWIGSIAAGLCLSFVALGVYISFRILDFPDLTIDGSFPLGASLAAAMIVGGSNPYLTLPVAFLGSALAGVATAVIATRLKIHSLLASILTTTALISINLRVMGRSNIPLLNSPTIFSPFNGPFRSFLENFQNENLLKLSNNLLVIVFVGLGVLFVKLLFDGFMRTELGLAMRATGDNQQMIRSLGRDTQGMFVLGLALSNGLVGLSGAIFAQYQGFADVNMGLGLIIAGLAAVIIGETIFRPRRLAAATLAVILGMVIYRLAIAAALNVSLPLPGGALLRIDAQDVKLATALLVLLALWLTHVRNKRKGL
jgi:putative tryptophan/tyrosine transport system permease protein